MIVVVVVLVLRVFDHFSKNGTHSWVLVAMSGIIAKIRVGEGSHVVRGTHLRH